MLHGYPSIKNRQGTRNKSFRAANNAWGKQSSGGDHSEAIPSFPGLNQEQSKQLMQFLTDLIAGNDQKLGSKEITVSAAHMAGTIYALNVVHCSCSLNQGTWILDSGAGDQMCSDKFR